MGPRRYAVLAVLSGTLVLSGWVAAELAGLGPHEIDTDGVRIALDTPRAATTAGERFDGVSVQEIINAAFSDLDQMPTPTRVASASTADPVQQDVEASALSLEVPEIESMLAGLPDPQAMLAPERIISASAPDPVQNDAGLSAPSVDIADVAMIDSALPAPHEAPQPVVFALASAPDDVQASDSSIEATEIGSAGAAVADSRKLRLVSLFRPGVSEEDLKPAVRPVETPNECLVAEICIDDYLWAFYERTPKVDTNKLKERVKATIRKKGKTRTVTKTITKYVVADFTWKDPIAAQKASMSVKDYVIGGMDRRFKLKLYHALRAMEDAGLMPGITSAFRDDYRQAIASGNKAASDSSYHGGSRRGGYGHGLAADLVSVKGDTRLERFASSVELWKWIDAHENELGIGRPYLNRDPPHVGPIDGKEFAAKRGGAKARLAQSIAKRRHAGAALGHADVIRPATTGSVKVRVGSI